MAGTNRRSVGEGVTAGLIAGVIFAMMEIVGAVMMGNPALISVRMFASVVLVAAAPAFTLAYAYATQLATATSAPARAWAVALAAGVVVWIPAALLFPWFGLAAVLWLAVFGLSVPAAMVERTSFAASMRATVAHASTDPPFGGASTAVRRWKGDRRRSASRPTYSPSFAESARRR